MNTKFNLPFKNEWFTTWGGKTREQNYHSIREQMFAMDFIIIDKDNKSYSGDSQKLESYYAFGNEVLAPADGEIVQVIAGVYDNPIGISDGVFGAGGNVVVIKHSDKIFSWLAHFKYNSITVKVGDKVKAGDVLGLCGNSGNSTEPHIHYHVQSDLHWYYSEGIDVKFDIVNIRKFLDKPFKLKKNYSPIKGAFLSNIQKIIKS